MSKYTYVIGDQHLFLRRNIFSSHSVEAAYCNPRRNGNVLYVMKDARVCYPTVSDPSDHVHGEIVLVLDLIELLHRKKSIKHPNILLVIQRYVNKRLVRLK